MSSMRFNARLDTSHHGPPHPHKDGGVVADSLTGIHSTMVKCLFVVNRSYIHKGVQVCPQVKIQRIQIWRWAWRPCSGCSCTYPSVMIGVAENISHSTTKICRSTVMQSFSYNSQIVSGHMLIWTFFLVLVCGTRALILSTSFNCTLYIKCESPLLTVVFIFTFVIQLRVQQKLCPSCSCLEMWSPALT
jgi:hypothetical protein